MRVEHTVTSLELKNPSSQPARSSPQPIHLLHRGADDVSEVRRVYEEIGAPHHWSTRPRWSDAQWREWLGQPERRTFLAMLSGETIGLVELELQGAGVIELVVLGLRPAFVGRRLGGALLVEAVERAVSLGATRIHLHTSSLDHSNALRNYERHGFQKYATEQRFKELPEP